MATEQPETLLSDIAFGQQTVPAKVLQAAVKNFLKSPAVKDSMRDAVNPPCKRRVAKEGPGTSDQVIKDALDAIEAGKTVKAKIEEKVQVIKAQSDMSTAASHVQELFPADRAG